ncbi:MAG: MBOAT family protein [Candidatus Zixiibacteriota bacterium]|nr:MAG: MBOAT family protein [candidate division Zixibacteria bacterium]
MLFNSFAFAIFFPVVLVLYWLLPFRAQNVMLLIASYFFYGYWDWRFLSLIVISTLVDYIAGLRIERDIGNDDPAAVKRRKWWLIASVCTNLGILGFFKYFNFFVGTFEAMLAGVGIDATAWHLNIVLPVGISFYTFQTMSYTIDVHRGVMKPTRNLLDFALYVSFFPQLVAGPIERAKELLPRITSKRTFNKDQFMDGLHLIFWGLFKKVFVADNLAVTVDRIFNSPSPSGFEVLIGAYTFAWQIYCDFSGYSDIARGCAKCLGIELMLNFDHPYVAVNPSDFWRRWHISLSSWLRDYLYVPLGGNRHGNFATYKNLALTMLLGGLWHGASWVFVLWGAYQGALLIAHRLLRDTLRQISDWFSAIPQSIRSLFKIIMFYQLVCVGWIIFRAVSMHQIIDMTVALFTWRGAANWSLVTPLIKFAGPLMLVELAQVLLKRDDLNNLYVPVWAKAMAYSVAFYLFAFYGAAAQSFIYFQF